MKICVNTSLNPHILIASHGKILFEGIADARVDLEIPRQGIVEFFMLGKVDTDTVLENGVIIKDKGVAVNTIHINDVVYDTADSICSNFDCHVHHEGKCFISPYLGFNNPSKMVLKIIDPRKKYLSKILK